LAWLTIAVLLAGCTPQPMTEQARQTHWLYNFFMEIVPGFVERNYSAPGPRAVDELTVWGLWDSCSVRPMGKRA
jgi:hypothetical protein